MYLTIATQRDFKFFSNPTDPAEQVWKIRAKTRALKGLGGIECSCVCGTESVFFLALFFIFNLINIKNDKWLSLP